MPFDDYYLQQGRGNVYEGPLWQAGGAIKGYSGRDLQYGKGFGSFGRAIWRFAKPILKYLGKQGIKAGVDIGSDVLSGKPVKETIENRLRETGTAVVDDAAGVVRQKLAGKGRMARRRRTAKKNKRPVIRRRRTVRRRRSTRRRTKKSLADIFT